MVLTEAVLGNQLLACYNNEAAIGGRTLLTPVSENVPLSPALNLTLPGWGDINVGGAPLKYSVSYQTSGSSNTILVSG